MIKSIVKQAQKRALDLFNNTHPSATNVIAWSSLCQQLVISMSPIF